MWPKEKENRQLLLKWPNVILYSQLYKWDVTLLLLTSTPLVGWCSENHLIVVENRLFAWKSRGFELNSRRIGQVSYSQCFSTGTFSNGIWKAKKKLACVFFNVSDI